MRGKAVLLLFVVACGAPEEADLVLLGGRVFTADSTRPWAEAVAIAGARILAVGGTAEVEALAGPATRTIELAGRVVIPGIIDAHTHFVALPSGVHELAFSEMDPDWSEVRAAVSEAAAELREGTPIRGIVGIRVIENPAATRFALDSLAPGRAVTLNTFYGHGDLLSTAALEGFGVSETEPDPPGGYFERVEGSDVVNGKIFEYAQWRLARQAGARTARTELVEQVRAFSDRAVRFGITSIHDMPLIPLGLFVEAVREADIPLRVRAIRFPMTAASGRRVDEGLDLRGQGEEEARIAVRGVKWILDGTPLERGAAIRKEYADRAGWRGRTNFPPDEIEALIRESLEREEQLLLHAVGDRTIEIVFDAMESIDDVEWPARRVRIEHGDGVLPDLIPRAAKLGVIVVQNPTHFALAPIITARFGPEHAYMPLRSLNEAGVPIALGSDGEPNPYLNIMLATIHPTRPEEAVDRELAVVAYTRGAAFADFRERDLGTLAPGMLADLAVLSQDIFKVPPPELPETESVLTLIGGRIVYDAGVLGPS